MFLDKGNILSNFNHLFDTEASCHISLYSHFGMGKTRLIQELSKSRKTLYFKAAPLSFEENIRMLKALCTRQFHKDFQQAKKLTDVLKLLAKHAEHIYFWCYASPLLPMKKNVQRNSMLSF